MMKNLGLLGIILFFCIGFVKGQGTIKVSLAGEGLTFVIVELYKLKSAEENEKQDTQYKLIDGVAIQFERECQFVNVPPGKYEIRMLASSRVSLKPIGVTIDSIEAKTVTFVGPDFVTFYKDVLWDDLALPPRDIWDLITKTETAVRLSGEQIRRMPGAR